jgi:vesicle coat complex subunit
MSIVNTPLEAVQSSDKDELRKLVHDYLVAVAKADGNWDTADQLSAVKPKE